jgi:hypothetical protein
MPALPPKPALKNCAPISFWLQLLAAKASPGVHLPFQPGICWYASLPSLLALPLLPVRSEKLGCSGQMPLSTMPMTTPSPLALVAQKPALPVSPRKAGVLAVSILRISSFVTASTPRICASFSAWAAVISAAKPLKT